MGSSEVQCPSAVVVEVRGVKIWVRCRWEYRHVGVHSGESDPAQPWVDVRWKDEEAA